MPKCDRAFLVARLFAITIGTGVGCAAVVFCAQPANAQTPAQSPAQAIPVVPAIAAAAPPQALRLAPAKVAEPTRATATAAAPPQWVFMTGAAAGAGSTTAAPAPTPADAPVDDARIARARLGQPLKPYRADVGAGGSAAQGKEGQAATSAVSVSLPVATRRPAQGGQGTSQVTSLGAAQQITSEDSASWVRFVDGPSGSSAVGEVQR